MAEQPLGEKLASLRAGLAAKQQAAAENGNHAFTAMQEKERQPMSARERLNDLIARIRDIPLEPDAQLAMGSNPNAKLPTLPKGTNPLQRSGSGPLVS
jgi:hypothetical protein